MLLNIRIYRHIIYYYGFFFSLLYTILISNDIDIDRCSYYFFGLSIFLFLLWFRYFCYDKFCFGYDNLSNYNSDTLFHFRYIRGDSYYDEGGKILVRIGDSDIQYELDLSILGISESTLSYRRYESIFGSNNKLHLVAFRSIVNSILNVKRKREIYEKVQHRHHIFRIISFIILCLLISFSYKLICLS